MSLTPSPMIVQPGETIRCDAEVFDGSDTAADLAYASVANTAPSISDLLSHRIMCLYWRNIRLCLDGQ